MNDTDMLPGSYPHRKIWFVWSENHIVEMRGGVTDAGRRQTISEDRATQPMEAGG